MLTLLPTKYFLPSIPSGYIARPELFQQLDGSRAHLLTLVSAPAGAGKTTSISAWAHSAHDKGELIGWLALDEKDNNASLFISYLIASLEEGGVVMDAVDPSPGSLGHTQEQTTPDELIQGILPLNKEIILILDDYHLVQNAQVHSTLAYLLEHAPTHLHFILITRSDPPLPLARLRVAGQLLEVRMDQLRFSEPEAAQFLKQASGLQLSAEDVFILNRRTEGWIAGLQMAAISLRGRTDPQDFVNAFAGSHRYIFDYLLEQVLSRQSPEVNEFLLQTSVLERFTASLCDAVTGKVGTAQTLLNSLERANLFLVPLDEERGWYRYHHLFSDLLRLILERNHPGLAPQLHRQACQWYQQQGILPEALQHALAAGDSELAASIVSENVLALVDHAEILPILSQIEAIPKESHQSYPWLELAHAWGLAYTGQNNKAGLLLDRAEAHLQGVGVEKRDKASGHIAAVRGYLAWTGGDQTEEAVALSEKAARLLPEEDTAVRALNLTTLGNALIQSSDDPRSIQVLEQALHLAQQAGNVHVGMLAASGLAYSCMLLGRWQQARQLCEDSIRLAETHQRQFFQPLTTSASAYAMYSRYWLENGEFKEALHLARKGAALSHLWGQVDTIMMCSQYLVYALSFSGLLDEASQAIREARQIASQGPAWHMRTVDYVELQIALDSDQQEPGQLGQTLRRIQGTYAQMPALIKVRVLLKQNLPNEALSLLEREDTAGYGHYRQIWYWIEKALAFHQKNDLPQACSSILKAIALAEKDNLQVHFLREGAYMEQLLRHARNRAGSPVFINRLIAVFEARKGLSPMATPVKDPLIESLSERESEVLGYLNSYLSTPEIAQVLVVSTNTVRTHIKNIYNKLGVHGRSAAIRRARELALLGD